MLIHIAVQIPYIVDELALGKKRPGVGQQLVQQQEFLGGQLPCALRRDDLQGAAIQHRGSHRQAAIRPAAIPPQQRLNAPEHLLLIHGLDHEIVAAQPVRLLAVLRQLLGRNHQNGQFRIYRAQLARKFIPVHTRHHDIQNHQIHMLPLHDLHGFQSIARQRNRVMLRFQKRAHKQSRASVVIHYQNMKHWLSPHFALR